MFEDPSSNPINPTNPSNHDQKESGTLVPPLACPVSMKMKTFKNISYRNLTRIDSAK